MLQPCVCLPVVEVDLAQAPDYQLKGRRGGISGGTGAKSTRCSRQVGPHLQLFVVERLQQMLGNQLVEALLQRKELHFNPPHEAPVHIEPE